MDEDLVVCLQNVTALLDFDARLLKLLDVVCEMQQFAAEDIVYPIKVVHNICSGCFRRVCEKEGDEFLSDMSTGIVQM